MQNIVKPIPLRQLTNEPLVSVWMANYNNANYLDESINSVLTQTYSNFELIICDDGSTDQSVKVIKKYVEKDRRIKLIEKKNSGVTAALNNIFEVSKGEIICFLDSDDYFVKTKIENVVNDFNNNSNCGVNFHSMIRVDNKGNPEGRYPLVSKIPSGWLAEDVVKNCGGFLNIPPMSGISIRKELTDYIFPINIEVKTNVDAFIMNTALFLSPACSNENELAYYRLHSQNLSNFSNKTFSSEELIRLKEKDVQLNFMIYNALNRWLEERTEDRKSTRLNSSHTDISRMPSSA